MGELSKKYGHRAAAAAPFAPDFVANQDAPPTALNGKPIKWIGNWEVPPGWRGRHMWTGLIIPYKATVECPRFREAPEIVFVVNHKEYVEKSNHPFNWMDVDKMPAAIREMILDCYGDDLTPAQRAICKDQIAAREAAQKKAEARPARVNRRLSDAPVRRASQSPSARRRRPKS